MKKIALFLVLICSVSLSVFGQDVLTEAYVSYEIQKIESDDPQVQAMSSMMEGSVIDVYFKNKKMRMDMDMMGGMVKMSTRTNTEDGEEGPNAMYMDMMGQKMRIQMNDEQMKQFKKENEASNNDFEVTYDDNDTKTILGFKCSKVAIVSKNPNEEGFSMTAYVTDQLNAPASVIQESRGIDFKGFPLEYKITAPMMTMSYAAIKLEKEVADEDFKPLEGYQDMSFDDFIKNMGAMQGLGQ